MNLQDLAGQFAGEPSYSTEPEPEAEQKLHSGGVIDAFGLGMPSGAFMTFGSAVAFGKSSIMTKYMEQMRKVTQGVGRALGGHIDVIVIDEMAELSDDTLRAVGLTRAGVGIVPTDNDHKALAAAKKRKDRGQKFPGTGWGKRK